MASSSKPSITDLPNNQFESLANAVDDAATLARRMSIAAEYGRFGVAQLAADFVYQLVQFTIVGSSCSTYSLHLGVDGRKLAEFDTYPQFDEILAELFAIWKRAVDQSADGAPKYVNDLQFNEFLLLACSKCVDFECPDDPDTLSICLDYDTFQAQFDGLSEILAIIDYNASRKGGHIGT